MCTWFSLSFQIPLAAHRTVPCRWYQKTGSVCKVLNANLNWKKLKDPTLHGNLPPPTSSSGGLGHPNRGFAVIPLCFANILIRLSLMRSGEALWLAVIPPTGVLLGSARRKVPDKRWIKQRHWGGRFCVYTAAQKTAIHLSFFPPLQRRPYDKAPCRPLHFPKRPARRTRQRQSFDVPRLRITHGGDCAAAVQSRPWEIVLRVVYPYNESIHHLLKASTVAVLFTRAVILCSDTRGISLVT